MLGKRVKLMGGTFEVSSPVQVTGAAGKEVLVTSGSNSNSDQLEGVPVI
jgi:hypothetical protein